MAHPTDIQSTESELNLLLGDATKRGFSWNDFVTLTEDGLKVWKDVWRQEMKLDLRQYALLVSKIENVWARRPQSK